MPGIYIGNMIARSSGAAQWTPQTLVVENAEPTKVVMTGTSSDTFAVASDFTISGFTISSLARDTTNKILTLTLSTEIYEDDLINVEYKGISYSATNNITAAQIGIILNDEFDSVADGWQTDKIGTGSLSATGGILTYSRTGAGDFASKIYYNTLGMTLLENWEIEIIESIAAKGATTYGLYIGVANPTAYTLVRNVIGGVILDTAGDAGKLSMWDHESNNFSSASAITFSNDDRIRLRFKREGNLYTIYAKNLTTDAAELSYNKEIAINVTNSALLPTAGYPCIQNLGGNVKVEYFKWSSVDYKKVNFALIGDSITVGYTASAIANRWASLLKVNSSKKSIILSAQASRTDEIALSMDELIRISPRKALILIGTNDFVNDTKTLDQIKTAYGNMITSIINAGIMPVILNVLPKSTEFEIADFNTWLNTTYGSTYDIVDLYSELVGVAPAINATYSTDGLHPNDVGHDLIYDTIVAQLPELL